MTTLFLKTAVGYAPLIILTSAMPMTAVAGQAAAPVAGPSAAQAPTATTVENPGANNPMCKIVPQSCIGPRHVAAPPAVEAPAAPESDVKQTVGVLADPDAGAEIQRSSEIGDAEALRGELRKTTGIAPLRLRRLDAALAVIANPTSTTAELRKAEAELDAFVAAQQAKSVSREAPAKEEKPKSSVQRVREEISKTFAGNIRS